MSPPFIETIQQGSHPHPGPSAVAFESSPPGTFPVCVSKHTHPGVCVRVCKVPTFTPLLPLEDNVSQWSEELYSEAYLYKTNPNPSRGGDDMVEWLEVHNLKSEYMDALKGRLKI